MVVEGGQVQRRVPGLIRGVDIACGAGPQELVQQARLTELGSPVQRRLALLQIQRVQIQSSHVVTSAKHTIWLTARALLKLVLAVAHRAWSMSTTVWSSDS